MVISALIAVILFAGAFLSIYMGIYAGAAKSFRRGELDARGMHILRLGLLGHIVIFASLAFTAFLI
jgi:hypothetical protein